MRREKPPGRGCGTQPATMRPAQRLSRPSPVLPVTEQKLVLSDRAHSEPVVAVVAVAHTVVVRTEVEVPRAARVVRAEQTRPVVAPAACAVEAAIATVADSGQEETVAVRSCEESAVHSVLLRPGHGRVVVEFLPFRFGRHAPVWSPVGRGRVILGQQGGQSIASCVFSESVAVTILVGTPVISVLRRGLAPGEVVAVVLGSVGAHITGGPQEATRQAEVDIVVLGE